MSERLSVSTSSRAVLLALIADLVFGLVILYAVTGFKPSQIDILIIIVTEILLIEIESIMIPAFGAWAERRLIVKGTSTALSKSAKLREEAKRFIYGVWCYSGYHYPELDEYFRREKELIKKGIKVHRIINVETAGIENVKKHCEDFKDEIANGNYIVTSVGYHSREFIVADRKKVFILYQDLAAKDVGGGLGPLDDPNWIASYADEFEELERPGLRLHIDLANPGKSIEDWINLSLQKK